ncbi:MAG: ABC transporter permease [Sandaracinaceae bacterium]|nr:ABC transporter permease [Sandaracinaceae bacterium]
MRRVGLVLIGLGLSGLALPAFGVELVLGAREVDWMPILGLVVLCLGVLATWEGQRGVRAVALTDPRAWRRFKKNRGAVAGGVLVIAVMTVGFVGPMLAPHPPDDIFDAGLTEDGTPVGPNDLFVLGADNIGRDELSRLLYGGRVSLSVALTAVAIAGLLGFGAGLVSGYFKGALDLSLMAIVDFVLSLPFLLIAIALNRVIENPALWTLCLLLGLLSWTTLARVTRAKTLQVRELEYVHAARALGATHLRILLRHVLPNVLGPAIVIGSTMIANMIIVESAMSFLGLGVKPPTASWGSMLRDGQEYLQYAPRLILYPGALIVMTVFGFNLLGEGLRDALDPKE